MRRRTRNRTGPVTPDLLERASTGSIPDIILLADSVQDGKCTVKALDVAFKFLHPDELVPDVERNRRNFRDPIDRAMNCMAILDSACQQSDSDPSLKTALIDHLIENVDGMCCWIRFLLLFPDVLPAWKHDVLGSHNRNAAVLCTILYMQDRVYDAYISSTECIDLALRLWFREDENQELLFDTKNRSLPLMMYALISREAGLHALVNRIVEKRLVGQLASSIIRRAQRVSEAPSLAVEPTPVLSYMRTLTSMISFLMDCDNEDIMKGFAKVHYLRELCTSLNTLSITIQKHHKQLLHMVYPPLHNLFTRTLKARTHVVDIWVDLVEGGVVPLFARLLPSVQRRADIPPPLPALSITTLAHGAMTHRRVIQRHLEMYPSGDVPGLKRCHSELTAHWKRCWEMATCFTRFPHSGEKIVMFCDNPACTAGEALPSDERSKKCDACCSVVYCSTVCQEEDWKNFHSRECRQARHNHADRRKLRTWYSHADRQFHMHWVAGMVTGLESQHGEGAFMIPDSDASPSDVMIEFDCSKGEATTPLYDLRLVSPEDLWVRREYTTFNSQEYLKPRWESMVQQYTEALARPEHRLASLILRFGAHGVIEVVVKLVRVGDAYQPVSSIARHGYDSEIDSLPPVNPEDLPVAQHEDWL